MSEAEGIHGAELLSASGLRKHFGPTKAIENLDFRVRQGEIVGLVGANGAGKSTLMKIVSGVVTPDTGKLVVVGQTVLWDNYTPSVARTLGIRVVHQELSLCRNLRVYENFYVEQSQRFTGWKGWRKESARVARQALDTVFPGNGIDEQAPLDRLSIAQQQMVEISRAVCDEHLKLLILDEPTASLPAEQTQQLQDYLLKNRPRGVSVIYISHRLKEITTLADSVFIMKNGQHCWSGATVDTCERDMIARMGEVEAGVETDNPVVRNTSPTVNPSVHIECRGLASNGLKNVDFSAQGGEIIGLAGLEGSGQLALLHAIFRAGHRKSTSKAAIHLQGSVAFVAGDRKKEGNFPLWSIADNMTISNIAKNPLFSRVPLEQMARSVQAWSDRLKVKSAGSTALITSLSGGNQQKVLIARAMIADADIILLDDPTRGVDVATKNQLYELFAEAAAQGKLVIWRSSDDYEFGFCTRVCVMSFGHLTADLPAEKIANCDLLEVAFSKSHEKNDEQLVDRRNSILHSRMLPPLVAMLTIYLVCGALNPGMFGMFGIELLISGFAPFVFAALAQAYIIGLGHVDLSLGAFMGLINVICASYLKTDPVIGALMLAGALAVYAAMGALIYYRRIPPIIVTLGMSFVWSGTAFTLMNMPGGEVPEWLGAAVNFETGWISGVTVHVILFTVLAALIYSTKYGTVLRGFGNNEQAMRNSGWSKRNAYLIAYLLAGVFALLGGALFSGITGSADANASKSYTLLTIAAVVMGGGKLEGGVVSHSGAVFGAVTLSLISMLLGFLGVNTDYTAAIQGAILLLVLAMGLLRKEGKQ